MLRLWHYLLTLALALLALGLSPHRTLADPTFQSDGLTVSVTENIYLRAGPGLEWRRLTVLTQGTVMRLDGRDPSGTWARGITPDGRIGWVFNAYLTAPPEQIAALPSIWVDTPFNLAPPEGGAPAQPAAPAEAPPADAPPPEAPAQPAPSAAKPPAALVNTAPVRGFNYGGHIRAFSDGTFGYMRRAGMSWVKKQWRFLAGQSPNDVAGWINAAHAGGFRILIGIVGLPGEVNNPGYLDTYAAFVGGVAGLGADAIEVWNEPNIDREWPGGSISPASYTEMLRRAYGAIKAANPNTLVISGAPAPTGFFGGCSGAGCDDNAFLAGMAAAGAANVMDCIGIHYNEGILPPDATSGDPRGNSGHYTRYFRSMMDVYSGAFGGARPLCFTEFGYLTPEGFPPLPGGFSWAQNVTLAQQASWLDQAVSMAANSGRVRLFIIWNVDFTDYGADPMAGYAIVRPDGSCPACDLLGS